jgi:hypothetical protein
MFQPKFETFPLHEEDRHSPGQDVVINLNQVQSLIKNKDGTGTMVTMIGVVYNVAVPRHILLTKMR